MPGISSGEVEERTRRPAAPPEGDLRSWLGPSFELGTGIHAERRDWFDRQEAVTRERLHGLISSALRHRGPSRRVVGVTPWNL